jgi:hypothetical protein
MERVPSVLGRQGRSDSAVFAASASSSYLALVRNGSPELVLREALGLYLSVLDQP